MLKQNAPKISQTQNQPIEFSWWIFNIANVTLTNKETAYVATPVPAMVHQQYVKEKIKDYFDIWGTKL